jgi:hypothetical protein
MVANGDHHRMAGPSAAPIWRDRLVLALAYTLAWGALLVNRGLYWDDWTAVGRTPAETVQAATELGQPLAAVVFVPLLSLPLPGLVGHAVIFGAYLASTLVLHAILRRVPGLTRMDALVAALTFAVLPVNFARIALADIMYGLSLIAFLGATWLLIRFVEDGGRIRRIAALALFLLSFYTASLLVFYVVPILLAAFVLRRSGRSFGEVVIRHLDFLALPAVYWLLKSLLFKPFGAYEGYNALSAGGLLNVPGAMVAVPSQVLVEPLSRAVSVAGVVGILAGIATAGWLVWRRSRDAEGPSVNGVVLVVIGAATVALGVFAYLAVGLRPTVWDWSSRHQLLVPLGSGLIAAGVARGVGGIGPAGRAGGVVVVGLLLGIAVVADARTLIAYQVDWFKQQALIEAVRTTPALQTARHIRVVDSASVMNGMRRTYRFYELNALFREATGNTRRLVALEGREPDPDLIALFTSRPGYQMSEYVPSPVDLEVRISTGEYPRGLDVLRLVVLEATGSPSFRAEVARVIEIGATPIAEFP